MVLPSRTWRRWWASTRKRSTNGSIEAPPAVWKLRWSAPPASLFSRPLKPRRSASGSLAIASTRTAARSQRGLRSRSALNSICTPYGGCAPSMVGPSWGAVADCGGRSTDLAEELDLIMIRLLVRESSSRILERVRDTSPRFAKPRPPTAALMRTRQNRRVRFSVRLWVSSRTLPLRPLVQLRWVRLFCRYGLRLICRHPCARSAEPVHRVIHRHCGWIGRQDPQQFGAALALDQQAIAGQPLTRRDAPDVERKIRDARQTARLGVEMRELEHPAMSLTAGVLARNPVEPALDAARQPEVGRIDGQHQRAVDHAAVEPIGQHEFHALDPARPRRHFLPFVDPGELPPSPMLTVADGGGDNSRLQAGQRRLQEEVLLIAGRTTDTAQQLIGREAEEARGDKAQILGADNLARCPDQHVGVPDRRHAVLWHSEHLHLDVIGTVEDRLGTRRFRQREERPLHQIALVARAGVAADR